MQELKFRVWDKTANQMIYLDDDNTHHSFIYIRGNAEYINLQNGSGGDEYEIMQYTGLKDKNGKEIYEGDIIEKVNNNLKATYELKPSKIGDIYFVVGMASGYTLCPIHRLGKLPKTCNGELIPNVWGYIKNYEFWNGSSTGCKIIGNIHEEKIKCEK